MEDVWRVTKVGRKGELAKEKVQVGGQVEGKAMDSSRCRRDELI
jgi:hypothetical protein